MTNVFNKILEKLVKIEFEFNDFYIDFNKKKN